MAPTGDQGTRSADTGRAPAPATPSTTSGPGLAKRRTLWAFVFVGVFAAGFGASVLVAAPVAGWMVLFGLGMAGAFGLALLTARWVGRRHGGSTGAGAGLAVLIGGLVFVYNDTAEDLTRAMAVAPLVMVGAIASAALYFRWPKASARAIKDLAARHGLHTADRLPAGLAVPSTPLPIPVSRLRTIHNVVWGEIEDRTYVAFELRWLEWHWVFYRRRRLGICLAPPTGARLPELSVEPQGWVSHFVTRITASDVNLESEDFNRRYLVRADDPSFVYDALSTRAMQSLIDLHPVALRVAGDAVFCWDEAGLSADLVTRGRAALDAFLTTMPSHTLGARGEPTPPSPDGLRLAGRYGDEDRPMPLPRVLAIGVGLAALLFPVMFLAAEAEERSYVGPVDATVTETAENPPFGPSVSIEFEGRNGRRVSTIMDTTTGVAAATGTGERIPIRFSPDDYGSAYWVGHMTAPGGDPRLIWGITGGLTALAVGFAGLDALTRRRRGRPARPGAA